MDGIYGFEIGSPFTYGHTRWSDVRHFNIFVNFKGQGEFWVIQGSTEEEGTLIATNEISSPRPVNDTTWYYYPNNDFQAEPIQIDNILIECNVATFEPTPAPTNPPSVNPTRRPSTAPSN